MLTRILVFASWRLYDELRIGSADQPQTYAAMLNDVLPETPEGPTNKTLVACYGCPVES